MLQSTEISARDVYIALAHYLGFILLALLAYFIMRRIVRTPIDKTATNLDNMALEALELPILMGIVLIGFYVGSVSMPLKGSADEWMRKGFSIAFITLGAYGGAKLIDAVLRWYAQKVAVKTKTTLDDKTVSVLRIAMPVMIGILVVFATLDIVGIFSMHSVREWAVQIFWASQT